uniref:Putative tetraspanin n=1 Tax=Ixodes ricinus TaxID=34613 RepID=V5IJY2_IXORI
MVQGCGMSRIQRGPLVHDETGVQISGIIIIVCGGYSLHLFKKTGPVIGDDYVSAPVILIVVGSIVFLVAFLGMLSEPCRRATACSFCSLSSCSCILVGLVNCLVLDHWDFVVQGQGGELGQGKVLSRACVTMIGRDLAL